MQGLKLETANDSVGEISLKSRVNPESKKREDLRVSRKYAEIMEEGGDVLVAYIVFQKDDREVNFQINFRSSRISFLMFASEDIFLIFSGKFLGLAHPNFKSFLA